MNQNRYSGKVHLKGFTPLHPESRGLQATDEWQIKFKSTVKPRPLGWGVTGFTLMEVLVSLVLIALTLTGLLSLFTGGKRLVIHNRCKMTGGELGKAFLDPLQMHVRQDEWMGSSNCCNCLSSYGTVNCPTSQSIGGINYTPNYTIDGIAGTGLLRVRLTINWSENAS